MHFGTYEKPLERHKNLHLVKKAAWMFNGDIEFCGTDYTGSGTEQGGRVIECNPKSLITVPAVDLMEFLSTLPSDAYIVMKMDIEGAEHTLLPHMLKSGALQKYVHELYLECHYEGRGAGKRLTPGVFRSECMDLIKELRMSGVYTHEWF